MYRDSPKHSKEHRPSCTARAAVVSTSIDDLIESLSAVPGDRIQFRDSVSAGERHTETRSSAGFQLETRDSFVDLDFESDVAALALCTSQSPTYPTSPRLISPSKSDSPVIPRRKLQSKVPTTTSPQQEKASKLTSKYRGVHYHKRSGKWRAQIQLNGKRVSIGSFATQEEAARAYDQRAREAQGARAKLNFPNCPQEGLSAAVAASSGYRGVCLSKRDQKWLAQVSVRTLLSLL